MPKDKFLLVNLQDTKSKKIAQILSNKSSRKILDYLTEHEPTASEISKELHLPMPTVHYNLEQLMDAGLVVVEHFHYSKKGKEVKHYKLANKYIIISQKPVYGIKQRLRSVLPAGLTALGAGSLLWLYNKIFVGQSFALDYVPESKTMIAERSAMALESQNMQNLAGGAVANEPNTILWFIAGIMFAFAVLISIELINFWRKRK